MADHPALAFIEREDRLFASIRVSSKRPPLGLDALHALLAQSGYENWRLSDQALVALLEAYNSPIPEFELPIG